MKTKLLKLALCAMALLPVGAWAAATTSLVTRTTITFDGTTAGTYQGSDGSTGAEFTFPNYSLAVYGTATARVITSVEGSVSGTIAGTNYSASKYLTMNSSVAWTESEFTQRTAGGNNLANNTFAPCIAFNTGVAGKVYVSADRRGSGNGNLKFAYQTAATTEGKYKLVASSDVNLDDNTGTKEIVYDVPEATTVLIRGNMKIYAIRFVPKATSTAVLTATSMWNFDQYVKADNTVAIAGGSSTGVKDFNGLYIFNRGSHAHNSHTASSVTEQTQSGYTLATSGNNKAMLLAAETNSTVFSGLTTGLANHASNAYDGFAVEVGCPGTVYVAYKCGGTGRKAYFYENGIKKSETSLTDGNSGILSYTISNVHPTTTVSFGVTGATLYVISVLFVPTSATQMEKTLSISAAGYATFCAPQNYRWSTSTYPNLKAYIISDEPTATSVTLSAIAASEGYITIPACTGVVLAGETGDYTLNSVETATAVGTNYLKANLADYALPANDGNGNYNYTLAAGPTFKHSSGSGTLAAGKAFLRTTVNVEGGSAPSLSLVFDNNTTGIDEAIRPNNDEGMSNKTFYNLSGQRVTNPTKGLYIVNGKKVVIK